MSVDQLTSDPYRSPTRWAGGWAAVPAYRWVIVVVAAMAMTGTLPGRTHGLGLITKPLLEDMRLSEVAFADLNFWSMLLGAALCWPTGAILDRFGARGTLVVTAALLGLVVIWMGRVHDLTALFAALTLTRGLGQGSLSVVSTALVGKWFTRKAGVGMGVFAVLMAIGFVAGVLGVGKAVEVEGWRTAWSQVGWALLLVLAPASLVFARSTPISTDSPTDIDTDIRDSADLTLTDALACPAFWIFTAASCLFGFTWSAVTLYNELILNERGFGRDAFNLVMGIIMAAGLATNLLGGWLATRWPLGRLLGIGMALLAASLAVFPFVRTQGQLVGYAVTFGAASGLVTVVHFAFHPQAFGRTHLGRIQGFFQVMSVFTSALGPVILARCKESFGSYSPLMNGVVPLSLLTGLAAVFVAMPKRAVLSAEGSVA